MLPLAHFYCNSFIMIFRRIARSYRPAILDDLPGPLTRRLSVHPSVLLEVRKVYYALHIESPPTTTSHTAIILYWRSGTVAHSVLLDSVSVRGYKSPVQLAPFASEVTFQFKLD